jgi:ribosomal protein S12 methylthiotransferase accessory factor
VFELGHVAPYIRRLMRDEEHPVPVEPRDVRALLDHALYYAPTERLSALEFLDSEKPLALSATAAEPLTRDDLCGLLRAGGVRVAVVDVTSPDLRTSPFRVARAVGEYIQPIDFGFALARLGNPRLQRLLVDGVNPHPHPIA